MCAFQKQNLIVRIVSSGKHEWFCLYDSGTICFGCSVLDSTCLHEAGMNKCFDRFQVIPAAEPRRQYCQIATNVLPPLSSLAHDRTCRDCVKACGQDWRIPLFLRLRNVSAMLSAESGGLCLGTATRSGVMPNYTILYDTIVTKCR